MKVITTITRINFSSLRYAVNKRSKKKKSISFTFKHSTEPVFTNFHPEKKMRYKMRLKKEKEGKTERKKVRSTGRVYISQWL